MSTGRFVVVEGGDGCGKTTQVARLAERLRSRGVEVRETFEPGATRVGEVVRVLVLDDVGVVDATTEALLLAADRAQHVAEVIGPSLARGAWVVSDRYVPSSLAYQGAARGLGVEVVEQLNALATGNLVPDLVVVVDVDAEIAESRHGEPGDRLERVGREFHAAVFAAYRQLAATRGWHVVDGSGSPDQVHEAIWSVVEPLLTR